MLMAVVYKRRGGNLWGGLLAELSDGLTQHSSSEGKQFCVCVRDCVIAGTCFKCIACAPRTYGRACVCTSVRMCEAVHEMRRSGCGSCRRLV